MLVFKLKLRITDTLVICQLICVSMCALHATAAHFVQFECIDKMKKRDIDFLPLHVFHIRNNNNFRYKGNLLPIQLIKILHIICNEKISRERKKLTITKTHTDETK